MDKANNASMPVMEVNISSLQKKGEKEIVSDDQMIDLYSEILDMCRDDRKEIDDMLGNFANMVINGGDASTSSKEALVNLMKMRADVSNNMSRVFDLLARIKMRDKSIPEVVAKQVNKFSIGGGQSTSKRKMLETLAKETTK